MAFCRLDIPSGSRRCGVIHRIVDMANDIYLDRDGVGLTKMIPLDSSFQIRVVLAGGNRFVERPQKKRGHGEPVCEQPCRVVQAAGNNSSNRFIRKDGYGLAEFPGFIFSFSRWGS